MRPQIALNESPFAADHQTEPPQTERSAIARAGTDVKGAQHVNPSRAMRSLTPSRAPHLRCARFPASVWIGDRVAIRLDSGRVIDACAERQGRRVAARPEDPFERDAIRTRARAFSQADCFPTDPSGRRFPWPLV